MVLLVQSKIFSSTTGLETFFFTVAIRNSKHPFLITFSLYIEKKSMTSLLSKAGTALTSSASFYNKNSQLLGDLWNQTKQAAGQLKSVGSSFVANVKDTKSKMDTSELKNISGGEETNYYYLRARPVKPNALDVTHKSHSKPKAANKKRKPSQKKAVTKKQAKKKQKRTNKKASRKKPKARKPKASK